MNLSEVLATQPAPDLVIIGHLAVNEDITPYGSSMRKVVRRITVP